MGPERSRTPSLSIWDRESSVTPLRYPLPCLVTADDTASNKRCVRGLEVVPGVVELEVAVPA